MAVSRLLSADFCANLTTIKTYLGCKLSTVAEGYIVDLTWSLTKLLSRRFFHHLVVTYLTFKRGNAIITNFGLRLTKHWSKEWNELILIIVRTLLYAGYSLSRSRFLYWTKNIFIVFDKLKGLLNFLYGVFRIFYNMVLAQE